MEWVWLFVACSIVATAWVGAFALAWLIVEDANHPPRVCIKEGVKMRWYFIHAWREIKAWVVSRKWWLGAITIGYCVGRWL